jgi:AcrR family transcriptional regulator
MMSKAERAGSPPARRIEAERRERVLDAALDVIAERGLAATRIVDISERAGMSAGHVLYYFGSKDRVLVETLRHIEDRMHRDARVELAAIAAGPDRISRLLELNLPDGLADPGWTLWLESWTLAPHDGAVRDLVAELERAWIALLDEVVRDGVEAGSFVCPDIDAAVARLYATINGLAVQVVTGVADLTPARALEICMEVAASELGFAPSGRRRRGGR